MRRFSPSITHAIEPASIVDITPGYAHVKALTTYSQTNETAMNCAPKPLPGNTRRSARPHKVLWGALALALVWIPLMAVAQIEESNSDEYTDLSNQDSFIWGNAGDDVIDSGGGDWINGNAGNDVISGGGFGNFLFGGIGNDDLDGGLGSDFLFGGSGDDVLIGSAGDDILQGDSKEYARPILPGWQVTYDNNSGSSNYGNVVVTVDGTDYDSDGMIMYHQAVSIFQAEILITAANPGNDTARGWPGRRRPLWRPRTGYR